MLLHVPEDVLEALTSVVLHYLLRSSQHSFVEETRHELLNRLTLREGVDDGFDELAYLVVLHLDTGFHLEEAGVSVLLDNKVSELLLLLLRCKLGLQSLCTETLQHLEVELVLYQFKHLLEVTLVLASDVELEAMGLVELFTKELVAILTIVVEVRLRTVFALDPEEV